MIDACVKLTGMPDLTLSFMVSSLRPLLRWCLSGGQTLRPSPRTLGCWTTSVSTRVSASSVGRRSGSSPSSLRMETSACCPTTSALRSQSVTDPPPSVFSTFRWFPVVPERLFDPDWWFFSLVAIPVYVKHNITFREGSSQGRFDLTLGPKQTMGKGVESVLVSSQLPRGVLNVSLNPSQGTYTFDPVTKVRRGVPSRREQREGSRLAEEHGAISPPVLDVVLGRWKDQPSETSQSERHHESAGRGLQAGRKPHHQYPVQDPADGHLRYTHTPTHTHALWTSCTGTLRPLGGAKDTGTYIFLLLILVYYYVP